MASIAADNSRIRIAHLAVGRDPPGPDRVVVVIVIVAAHTEEFGQRRLHVSGFVDGAALDHGRLAVPVPGQPETGQRARQYRLLPLRFLPALAVIDRDVDALDLAMTAPGDAGDLVKARRGQLLAARRPRDDGFGFHVEGEF